ncbi:MAG: amidohydrolase family protein [Thermodesulfobacteriota bacterium]
MIQYDDFQYFDVHVHFFPRNLLDSIWKYFEDYYWPIYLKDTAENLAFKLVSDFKVKHFLTLNYAHKRGVARSMNDWTYSFCSSPQLKGIAIPFGTIHPGDEDRVEETDRILGELGFEGIKLQLMVTDFYVYDQRMKPIYDKIIEYDKVLLIHVGTGPTYTNYFPETNLQSPYTGVKYLEHLMEEYPEMKVVVPHMGTDEYEAMWSLTKEYPNLYFDSAMICVKNNTVFDDKMRSVSNERLYEISDRILFGSDFPNIPYDYRNSVLGWLERGMDYSFYEKIFYKNAERLFHEYI